MTTIDQAIANAYAAGMRHQEPAGNVETVIVQPVPDSPLEALLCMYETNKSELDAAKEKWESYHSSLVAALRAYEPDENVKAYEVPPGRMWPGISVAWQAGREYLPTDLIRQHIPQVWDAFKQRTKGYWVIRAKKGKR
jgi:hypothetical protein